MAQGHDNLYKCSRTGNYTFRYTHPKTGKLARKSTATTNFVEAKSFRTKFLVTIAAATISGAEYYDLTLRQVVVKWQKETALEPYARKSLENHARCLKQLLRAEFADRKVNTITVADINNYKHGRVYRDDEGRIRNAVAFNGELSILRLVLKFAGCWHPLEGKVKPAVSEELIFNRALERDEELRLIETAAANAQRCPGWIHVLDAAILAAETGLRGGEIKSIRLRNIIQGDGRWYIDLTRKKASDEKRKTKQGQRKVVLTATAKQCVERLLERAQSKGACEPEHCLFPADLSRHTKKTDPLYGSGSGWDVTTPLKSWRTSWRNLTKAAGLEGYCFHGLRHTFISDAVDSNIPQKAIEAQVGHSKLIDRYVHARKAAKEALANAIEAGRGDIADKFQSVAKANDGHSTHSTRLVLVKGRGAA